MLSSNLAHYESVTQCDTSFMLSSILQVSVIQVLCYHVNFFFLDKTLLHFGMECAEIDVSLKIVIV
jgi:hypothetical protein